MDKISAEQQVKLEEGLRLYVQHRWTLQEFADYLGKSKTYTAKILKGQVLDYVPRPEGLQYPWPEGIDQTRLLPKAKVLEAFQRYQAEDWSLMDFVSFLGVSPATGYAIFRGEIYADIPRPKKMDKRTQRQRERQRAKNALWMMIRYQWNLNRIQQYLAVADVRSVYRLLERKTFPDLFDELYTEGWDVQAYIDEFLRPVMTPQKNPVKGV